MNSELPIQLYKANAELQLQITRLLQESGHHWRKRPPITVFRR